MKRKNPFVIGLTGSIGMGKSTTAKMFEDEGVAIWSADAAVHRLYEQGGAGVSAIRNIYSKAVENGSVNRSVLKDWIAKDRKALKQIEKVVHPLVARDRSEFLASITAEIVLLEIPLLLETQKTNSFDLIVVVSAPENLQRERVLERPGMTPEQLDAILEKQMPDSEKRKLADVVIPTETLEQTKRAVQSLLKKIRKDHFDA